VPCIHQQALLCPVYTRVLLWQLCKLACWLLAFLLAWWCPRHVLMCGVFDVGLLTHLEMYCWGTVCQACLRDVCVRG
jgi:hypothetical protein